MTLTKDECALLVRKLEYAFKKKATAELESKTLSECSANAKLLHKLIEGAK